MKTKFISFMAAIALVPMIGLAKDMTYAAAFSGSSKPEIGKDSITATVSVPIPGKRGTIGFGPPTISGAVPYAQNATVSVSDGSATADYTISSVSSKIGSSTTDYTLTLTPKAATSSSTTTGAN